MRAQQEGDCREAKETGLRTTQFCTNFGLPAFKLWDSKFLVFKPPFLWYFVYSKLIQRGCLNSSIINTWGSKILCWWAILFIMECLAAYLGSMYQISIAALHLWESKMCLAGTKCLWNVKLCLIKNQCFKIIQNTDSQGILIIFLNQCLIQLLDEARTIAQVLLTPKLMYFSIKTITVGSTTSERESIVRIRPTGEWTGLKYIVRVSTLIQSTLHDLLLRIQANIGSPNFGN